MSLFGLFTKYKWNFILFDSDPHCVTLAFDILLMWILLCWGLQQFQKFNRVWQSIANCGRGTWGHCNATKNAAALHSTLSTPNKRTSVSPGPVTFMIIRLNSLVSFSNWWLIASWPHLTLDHVSNSQYQFSLCPLGSSPSLSTGVHFRIQWSICHRTRCHLDNSSHPPGSQRLRASPSTPRGGWTGYNLAQRIPSR